MAVVGEPPEGIFGSLLPQMILEPTLLRNVFHDDLEAFFFAWGADFASAESDLKEPAVLSSPVSFEGSAAIVAGVPQYLFPSGRIAKNAPGMIRSQELLSGGVTKHGNQGLIHIQKVSFLAATTHPVG